MKRVMHKLNYIKTEKMCGLKIVKRKKNQYHNSKIED